MKQKIFDITPTVSPALCVWPGDTPCSREVLCEITKGATVTLSTLRATVHLGAHADGPNHYDARGRDIASQDLSHYLGPCVVWDVDVRRGARVGVGDVAGGPRAIDNLGAPRVLFKTGTFPDARNWNSDFAGLSVALIDALAERGVRTIGIDTPSVDLQDSKDLPAHAAMFRHDIAILEGLALAHVPAGDYELIALPLKLEGFDASPVRAVLRSV